MVQEHFTADDSGTDDENSEVLLDEQDLEANDEVNEDGASDEDAPPEFDMEQALEDVRSGSMSRTDFATFQQGLNRQLGQVKSLQSTVSKLEKNAVDGDAISSDSEILSALLEALPTVLDTSDPSFERIRNLQAKRAQAQVTRDAIAKIREETDEPPASDGGTGTTLSDEQAVAWNQASGEVNGYARAKGIDPNTIEKAVWDKAVADANSDPRGAVDLMYKVVDGLVAGTDSKQSNRAARKAAGNAGTPGKSGSGSGGSLTLAKLQGMTQAQIMKLPQEEVDRVIAQA